ncbi:MAG: hypothetical protein LBJ76_06485 [Candidatus Accumulibacter sp.]|jgi:hypothetical protein|nr:hypothetical protein [Accumulibacter sp.]
MLYRKTIATLSPSIFFLTGCFSASMNVRPVSGDLPKFICIKENPKVAVDDFVPVIQHLLFGHGIQSEVFEETKEAPEKCGHILTYVAWRRWDVVPFLYQADLRLMRRSGEILASASYTGGGGFNFSKFAGTETKMAPVIDALLGKTSVKQLSPETDDAK